MEIGSSFPPKLDDFLHKFDDFPNWKEQSEPEKRRSEKEQSEPAEQKGYWESRRIPIFPSCKLFDDHLDEEPKEYSRTKDYADMTVDEYIAHRGVSVERAERDIAFHRSMITINREHARYFADYDHGLLHDHNLNCSPSMLAVIRDENNMLLANSAVSAYNKNNCKENIGFEVERVVEVKVHAKSGKRVSWISYDMTFTAKDVIADRIETFEALVKVYFHCDRNDIEVESCRIMS